MKKEMPLKLLQLLEPFNLRYREYYAIVDKGNHVFKAVDKDTTSGFYFLIEQLRSGNEKTILVNYQPGDPSQLTQTRTWIKDEHFEYHFEKWLKILKGYDEVTSYFDDPFVGEFSKNYYDEFELIDEEDANSPLTTKQILLLDKHLDLIESRIPQLNKDNEELKEIINDAKELRNDLGKKTKKQILRGLSKIWGKIKKQGAPFIKEFLSEGSRQLIREGVKLIINEGSKLIN